MLIETAKTQNDFNAMRVAQKKNVFRCLGPLWIFAKVRVYIRGFLWKIVGENLTRILLEIGRYLMNESLCWKAKFRKDEGM